MSIRPYTPRAQNGVVSNTTLIIIIGKPEAFRNSPTMFCPTPDDGCAGDSVVASHTGLPDPWVEAPLAPWDIGDVWLGDALTVHRGGICPSTNPNRPRVFGFISVGTSRFDYNNLNTCPVVVPPWASKAAASPHGSKGPHATCGAVGCEVLLDVRDDTMHSFGRILPVYGRIPCTLREPAV